MDAAPTPAEMTCPKCQSAMTVRSYADANVAQCGQCQGVFLDRADLSMLSDAEIGWFAHSANHTQPVPRITADMTAPPPPSRQPSRSFLESIFKG